MNKKQRGLFLTAVATGTMLNPLNSSMISLALHSIQHEFSLSFATVSWLISTYYLASAIFVPIAGKVGDLIGRRKMMLIGLLLVAVSAVGAPFAGTFMVLLGMRLFQAVGSSAIYPAGMALVRKHIHEKQASALAILSIFTSSMLAFGPTAGGFLIDFGGWPAIFTVNAPFILLSFLLTWFAVPKDPDTTHYTFRAFWKQLDSIGIAFFAIGMSFLLYFLLSFEHGLHWIPLGAGIVSLAAFFVRELKAAHPFIDVRLLRTNRRLTLVYIQFIFLNIFNYSLFFGLPSFFQDVMLFSLKTSGLMMIFLSGASTLVAFLMGRWIDHAGTSVPTIVGGILMFGGPAVLVFISQHLTIVNLAVTLIFLGISYGIGNVTLQAAMLDASPDHLTGTSSGLFQTCRYIGSILSSVVLAIVFGADLSLAGFHTLMIILTVTGIAFSLSAVYAKRLENTAAD
ncbi:MFS transporter [Terribacillus sp. DMT04]|uniref:MFS transporter n=1 Tax=Terribacillus sp. DMT04 TaxID=2850441 RepID=UPI001C2C1377|nr:MFS transporter [Terribacillus sp. DMT04]QXE01368.1 MFS transporter [Terribacillus sp. DMT04]